MLNTKRGEAIRMALCFIISSQRLPPLLKKNLPTAPKMIPSVFITLLLLIWFPPSAWMRPIVPHLRRCASLFTGSGGRKPTNGEDELRQTGRPEQRWDWSMVLIYGRGLGGGAQCGLSGQNQIRFRLMGWGGGDSESLTLPEWCQRSTFGLLELACWFCLGPFSTHTFVKTDGHSHGQGMHAHTHAHKTAAGVFEQPPSFWPKCVRLSRGVRRCCCQCFHCANSYLCEGFTSTPIHFL